MIAFIVILAILAIVFAIYRLWDSLPKNKLAKACIKSLKAGLWERTQKYQYIESTHDFRMKSNHDYTLNTEIFPTITINKQEFNYNGSIYEFRIKFAVQKAFASSKMEEAIDDAMVAMNGVDVKEVEKAKKEITKWVGKQ